VCARRSGEPIAARPPRPLQRLPDRLKSPHRPPSGPSLWTRRGSGPGTISWPSRGAPRTTVACRQSRTGSERHARSGSAPALHGGCAQRGPKSLGTSLVAGRVALSLWRAPRPICVLSLAAPNIGRPITDRRTRTVSGLCKSHHGWRQSARRCCLVTDAGARQLQARAGGDGAGVRSARRRVCRWPGGAARSGRVDRSRTAAEREPRLDRRAAGR
jgi:hypothetical protein